MGGAFSTHGENEKIYILARKVEEKENILEI
jgi:hypothetical protein